MPRLGVLGWPVAHSRSPVMHNAALAALGMAGWRYQRLPVPPLLLSETVRALGACGFAGANATIPHKRAVLAIADRATEAARAIGAANTLTFERGGAIAAENTDAPGLIAALGEPPQGMRALVLGAGGSARAAVWALREAGAAEVLVWNRTPARARELAAELDAVAVSRPVPADLLVNCTSVGLEQRVASELRASAQARGRREPGGPAAQALKRSAIDERALNQLALTLDVLREYSNVVDLVYGAGSTDLLTAARALGAHTVEGLEVLVAQGALSFEMWTGRRAPIEVIRTAARSYDGDA